MQQARELALEEAKKSECVRRKYGAILYEHSVGKVTSLNYEEYAVGYNRRVSRCCDGNICIRDLRHIQHGHNTDFGAEIHAEQQLLINMNWEYFSNPLFLIAGYNKFGEELYGIENWPCYVCARMIKATNEINSVWVPDKDKVFSNYTIDGILESYDQEFLDSLGDF